MENWFWYFVVYSLLGCGLEVLFARLTRQKKRDRKCFYLLPLCPVYGLGAIGILLLPQWVRERTLLLILLGGLTATGVEYLVGLFDEKVLGVRFWNYSHLPWNVGGKICLAFTAAWGILAWLLVRVIHPWVAALSAATPFWLLLPAALLVAGDGVRSAVLLRRAGTTQVLRWYS